MPNPSGRPRSIDLSPYHCPNPNCPDKSSLKQNLVARGTYRTKAGEQRRRITCRTCGHTFSSQPTRRHGRPLHERTLQYAILLLTKSLPIRRVARIVHASNKRITTQLHHIAHDFEAFLDLQIQVPAINGKELDDLLTHVRNNELRQRAAEWTRHAHQDPTFIQRIANQLSRDALATRKPRLRSHLHR